MIARICSVLRITIPEKLCHAGDSLESRQNVTGFFTLRKDQTGQSDGLRLIVFLGGSEEPQKSSALEYEAVDHRAGKPRSSFVLAEQSRSAFAPSRSARVRVIFL